MNLKINEINNFEKENDWRDSLIAWFGNIGNQIEKIFTKEIHTETLCVKKSDGTEICITGDELDQVLINRNTNTNTNIVSEIIPEPEPEIILETIPEPEPESINNVSELVPEIIPEPEPTQVLENTEPEVVSTPE